MSFYDETLKARHEDDDDEFGDVGGYNSSSVEEDYEEEEEESRGVSRRWPMIVPEYDRRPRDYGVALTWSF